MPTSDPLFRTSGGARLPGGAGARRASRAWVAAALLLSLPGCGGEDPVGGTGERQDLLQGDVLGPVRVAGTPYEMGWHHGRLLRAEIRDRLARPLDASLLASLRVYAGQMRPLLPVPLEQELKGLAAGAGVTADDLFLREVAREGERWHDEAAPTIRAALGLSAEAPASVLAAYEGLDRLRGAGRLVLLVREPTGGTPTVGLSLPGGLGLLAGMSKAGVAAAEGEVSGVPEERRSLHGIPFAVGLRVALERAKDAKDLLDRLPRLVGNRVVVADRAGGRFLAVLHLAAEAPAALSGPAYAAADGRSLDAPALGQAKDDPWAALAGVRAAGAAGPAIRLTLGDHPAWEVRPAGGAPVSRAWSPP